MTAASDVILFGNNKSALLNNDFLSGDAAIVLAGGQGSGWPLPAAGQYFVVTVQNLVTGAFEVCHVTNRSGDILNVERAKEGTAAQTFNVATAIVQMRVTKGVLEKMIQQLFTGADVGKFLQVQADGRVLPALGGTGVTDARQVATVNSLTGGGDLSVDRTLQLVNDSATPGANKFYGTNAAGVRGYQIRPSIMRGAAFVNTAALTLPVANVAVHIPRAATISRVVVHGDLSGSCTVTIGKQARTTYTGGAGANICGTDFPTIAGAYQSSKTAFTGWTLAIPADDLLIIGLSAVATFKRVIVQVYLEEDIG